MFSPRIVRSKRVSADTLFSVPKGAPSRLRLCGSFDNKLDHYFPDDTTSSISQLLILGIASITN
jgi:hypothetical protein